MSDGGSRAEQYAPLRPAAAVVHTGGKWVRPGKVVRITDLFTQDPMLTRLVLFRTPWFGLQIHKWHRPDNDRDLHNHPRSFVSFILRGGYVEETGRTIRHWVAGSSHRVRLNERHKVLRLFRVPTWTLVAVGPPRQRWGFFTPDGFVDADDYKTYVEAHTREGRG